MRISTDEDGARNGPRGPPSPEAELVVLLGDSYTFGWGVDTEETYPAFLDERLAAESGSAVRVLNLGVGGYGLTQASLRLARWVARHPEARVRAVAWLHSHNDMSDEAWFEAARRGIRPWVPVPSSESRSHAVNLVRRSLARTFSAAHRSDVLFGVECVDARLPMTEEEREILSPDQEQPETLARKTLTPFQRRSMLAAIERAHALARAKGAVFVHAVIHSAPPWYVAAIEELCGAGGCYAADIRFAGRIPPLEGFDGPLENEHSGLHFTPALNRRYADAIADELRAAGRLPGPETEPDER
jgi:lysophospholipase L1-like esterase